MKILFFALLYTLNINSNIYIKCKNITNKYIFFDLENNKELIVKDIFLKQYNKNYNFLIDTMGFISGIFLSKELRYDFLVGDICSPMNSYRTFEGHISALNFNINCNHKKYYHYFPIAIFKEYNRIKFYEKNIKFNGIMGLALNFTEEVKYSIMNYFKNELNIIDKNQFSIYQNKFILGEIDIYSNLKINYCNCGNYIYNSFIYFFWNCNVKSIALNNNYLNNYYKDIKISILFDTLLKENILSTNTKIAKILLNQIKDELNTIKNICNIEKSYIFCMNDYYNDILNMNLKIILENETYIEIPFNLKNKTEKCFYLNIEVNDFNIDKNQNIIKIGNEIFKSYFVTFDVENKRIGLKKYENMKLYFLLDEKNYYSNIFQKNKLNNHKLCLLKILFIIVILSSVFGIILLFYSKNNFSEVYNL